MTENEEKRGFSFEGKTVWITLTELQERLSGVPTKHLMVRWDFGTKE